MASLRWVKTLDDHGSEAYIMIAMVKDSELGSERMIAIKNYMNSTPLEHVSMERTLLTKLQGKRGIAKLCSCAVQLAERQLPLEYASCGDFYSLIEKMKDKALVWPITRNHIHQIFDQLLNGLNSVLSLGYVHRDIKPENILVYSFNENSIELGLADFGAAIRLGDVGWILGTEQYVPPKLKKKACHRYTGFEDLYGMGTTLVLFMAYVENKANYPKEIELANRIRSATPKELPSIMNDLEALIQVKNEPISTPMIPDL